MSGLVAIVSREPATLARGPRMLATLRHLPHWGTLAVASAGVWLGVCGRHGEFWVADALDAAPLGGLALAPLVAAFCGDLLNKRALIADLGLTAGCDPAQIVLAAYQRWGERLFTRLEGIYSLALHDARADVVLAGTDSCMVAPLNAVRLGDDRLFASEAKAFLADPRFVADLDHDAWADLAVWGSVLGERTCFSGVRKLAHGCHWKVAGGTLLRPRHFDVRELLPGALRGRDYTERMATAALSLADEAFDGERIVLPLTGGLDSRTMAAAMPRDAHAIAVTFGTPSDLDCALAARIAEQRGLDHVVLPFDPAYVAKHAEETVWLTEGRQSPVNNITGSLMGALPPAGHFVSGVGASAGRRYERTRMLVPQWAWIHAGEADFERLFTSYVELSGLPIPRLGELVVNGDELRDVGLRRLQETLVHSRGLNAVDRLDVCQVTEGERFDQAGLELADTRIGARAPLATQRWLGAMLAGASDERIDDRARVRLVRRLDPRLAAVPWGATRLPLSLSEHLLGGLRSLGALTGRPLPAGDPAVAGLDHAADGRRRSIEGALAALKRRHTAHGEAREEWLRGPSRAYVEENPAVRTGWPTTAS